MSNYTPGPWVVGTDRRYPAEPCIDAVIDGTVWHVALCHLGPGPDDSCALANACLIASAPDLYESLKDALPVLRGDCQRQAAMHHESSARNVSACCKAQARYEAALAAIGKAEGPYPSGARGGETMRRK